MINEIKRDILKIYDENKSEKNKLNKHNKIQREICKLSKKYGFNGEIEYVCNYIPSGKKDKREGRIDVVWKNDNKVILAIEIDSSPRSKSVIKLNNTSCDKIWLYYGNNNNKLELIVNEFDKDKKIKYLTPKIDMKE